MAESFAAHLELQVILGTLRSIREAGCAFAATTGVWRRFFLRGPSSPITGLTCIAPLPQNFLWIVTGGRRTRRLFFVPPPKETNARATCSILPWSIWQPRSLDTCIPSIQRFSSWEATSLRRAHNFLIRSGTKSPSGREFCWGEKFQLYFRR